MIELQCSGGLYTQGDRYFNSKQPEEERDEQETSYLCVCVCVCIEGRAARS